MSNVKNPCIGKSIAEKIQKAENINTKMTGNLNYPTPLPTLGALILVTTQLSTLNDEAMSGDTLKIKARDLKEVDFDKTIADLGDYVQFASGGDSVKILGSGYEVAAEGSPAGELPPPDNFRIRYLKGESEGKLRLLWKPVDNAKAYVVENTSTPTDDASWKYVTTLPGSRITLSGLKSGEKMWFRIRAVGAAGNSAPSDVAGKIVP